MRSSWSAASRPRPLTGRNCSGCLQFVAEHRVKYVIVHKVDRLARNRADDVAINLALKQAGAELVSVSENIDQTPSGLLLHGIMSRSPSSTAATWRRRSSRAASQKAKNGGTPGTAPIGYLNVRQIENGREVRTVEVDPERGPLMAWAFEAYATGDWTIRRLLAELTDRGLTTAPGPQGRRQAARRLAPAHAAAPPVLHGPGALPRRALPRQARAAVDARDLAARSKSCSPPRTWRARSTASIRTTSRARIYCGQCGSSADRLPRQRTTAAPIPTSSASVANRDARVASSAPSVSRLVEAAVAAHYATVQLPEAGGGPVAGLSRRRTGEAPCATPSGNARCRRGGSGKLEGERKKLLDAHYADADPARPAQERARPAHAEIADAEGRLAEVEGDFQKAEANLNARSDAGRRLRGGLPRGS